MITLKEFLIYYPKYCEKIRCHGCPLEGMDEDCKGKIHFWCKFSYYLNKDYSNKEYYIDITSLVNDARGYVELAKQFEKKQAEAF